LIFEFFFLLLKQIPQKKIKVNKKYKIATTVGDTPSSPLNEEHSSSSSDRSSTCVESVENKYNSKSSQYSSSTTIVSVDSSAFNSTAAPASTNESTTTTIKVRNKSKKILNSTQITTTNENDPFRNAPFRIQPSMDILNSSSSNSSASSSISNDKLNEIMHLEKQLNLNNSSNDQQQPVNNNVSAFQPYKRPPDPFVSAPFDHMPVAAAAAASISKSCSSPTSSITPTSSAVHSSGGGAGVRLKKKQLDPNSPRKRSTTVNYRSNSKSRETNNDSCNKTPLANKKVAVPNPFMNAPFSAKKSSKQQQQQQVPSSDSYQIITKSSNLIVAQVPLPPLPHMSASNSLNSIDESQITPTVSNYSSSSMDAAATAIPNVQFIQSLTSSSFQTQNLTTKSHLANKMIHNPNDMNNIIKIPQSHSLNEIKQTGVESTNNVNTVILTSKYNNNNIDDQFEPIIDTSKLQFKKRPSQQQQSAHLQHSSNNKQQLQIIDNIDNNNKKLPLTKSSSANSSILQTNNDNKPPMIGSSRKTTTNSNSTTSSGGIANMSFDDY